MTYGIQALRRLQLVLETTAGTDLACTEMWRGTGSLVDATEYLNPDEDIGTLFPGTRSYLPFQSGTLTLDETPATFEQLPILLCAGVEAVTTGTIDSSGYVYQFDVPPASTLNSISPLTVEYGDNVRVDECNYMFVKSFSLSGASKEAWMMGAELEGRAVADAEFTSLTPPTVEEMLFGKSQLWIDTTTIGTTTITSVWLGFSLDCPTGWQAIFSGDGQKYFSTIKSSGFKDNPPTGTITLEHDSTHAVAEMTAARAGTVRLIKVQCLGTALTSASAYTYKTFILNAAIKYTSVPEIGDQDGDDVIELPFQVVSNGTLAAQFIVVNNLQTLGIATT